MQKGGRWFDRFRHLLDQHQLGRALFETLNAVLRQMRLLLQTGTIVDATIITPSSTKNADGERDPAVYGDQSYAGAR